MTDEQRQREAAEDAALYEFLTRESEFYRGRTRELEAEVEALRAQVQELQALGVSLHKAADAGAQSERAAVVTYLRAAANAPHPIERGVPSLSTAGRGLLLLHADRIERGDHRQGKS